MQLPGVFFEGFLAAATTLKTLIEDSERGSPSKRSLHRAVRKAYRCAHIIKQVHGLRIGALGLRVCICYQAFAWTAHRCVRPAGVHLCAGCM